MDLDKQYDEIGPDYISGQKSANSKHEGEAIDFLKNLYN